VAAADLLPERLLDGDEEARDRLLEDVYDPLVAAGGSLLDTLTVYLETGGTLEGTARLLFVHPNTVRYRLRRVTELCALSPSSSRGALTLRLSLALGRLEGDRL
jgi:DNA-binding PucR family transcriptional regulator